MTYMDDGIEMHQCFEHQVITTILFGQSRIIVNPQMNLQRAIESAQRGLIDRVGFENGLNGAALHIELGHRKTPP